MRTTKRCLHAIVLAGLLVVAAGAITLLQPRSTPIRAQPQPPGGRISSCTGTITGTVSADTIRMCDPLTVTAMIAPQCPVCPDGVSIVYVQMDVAHQGDWMIQESLSSLGTLRTLATEYPVKVGVVRYDSQDVRTPLKLTHQINAATGPLSAPVIDEIFHEGPYSEAARAALSMIVRARGAGHSKTAKPCEFIVFFAYGKGPARRSMLEAASLIHSEKVNLLVACPMDPIQSLCANAEVMAQSRRNYTGYSERGKIRKMLGDTMVEIVGDQTVRDLYMTQFMPSGLAYVGGSASIPPVRQTAMLDGRIRLDWEWKRLQSTASQTVTYEARPLAEGTWPISGTLRLVDMANLQSEAIMPTRAVTVSGLCLPDPSPTPTDPPTPTPTETSTVTLAPTATPTATPSPTASATPTPPPTATPTPRPIYLPLLLRETCAPDVRRVDVVLAIDASSSMTERTPAGRTKIDAAIAAARAFLGALRFDRGDQAAIVAFNAGATLLAPLTGDRAALDAALAAIRTAPQTCIACAVETAAAELGSPRHVPAHTATMILLTDGRSNPRPASEAVDRAAAAKARGVVVFTIGLGIDLDDAALAAMASRPAYFYRAPEAEGLADIYAQIAMEIPCPAETFWGGR